MDRGETMKKRSHIGLMLGGLVMMLIISSHAQSPAKVNIPFDFNVGDTTLKAGAYSIQSRATDSKPEIVGVRDGEGRLLTLVVGDRVDEKENKGEPRLLFHKLDGRYYLAQVWFDGTGSGVRVPAGRAERESARAEKARAENLVVALAQ
jgi:hypothetical protein